MKKWFCKYCPLQFNSIFDLHLKFVHKKEVDAILSQTNSSESSKKMMENVTRSDGDEETINKKKMFSCEFYNKTISEKGNWKRHVKSIHEPLN